MLEVIKSDVTNALYHVTSVVSVTPEFHSDDNTRGSCTVVVTAFGKTYSFDFGWKLDTDEEWYFCEDETTKAPGDIQGILEWFVKECLIKIHCLEFDNTNLAAEKARLLVG